MVITEEFDNAVYKRYTILDTQDDTQNTLTVLYFTTLPQIVWILKLMLS
jgi:hypothetical protein